VAAPADPEVRGPALAPERAARARDPQIGHGLAAARIHATGATQTELVEILVTEAPR
jgi:hypothetical protein